MTPSPHGPPGPSPPRPPQAWSAASTPRFSARRRSVSRSIASTVFGCFVIASLLLFVACTDTVAALARPCAVHVHPDGLADVVRPKRTMGGVFSLALSSRLSSSHSAASTRGERSDGDDGWWRDPLTARCREARRARQRKRRRTDVWRTAARARTPFGELPPHRAAAVPTHAILNAAPVRNPLTEQARDAIARYAVNTVPVVIHQRIDHVHAYTAGLSAAELAPRSKAARELEALFAWITQGALL